MPPFTFPGNRNRRPATSLSTSASESTAALTQSPPESEDDWANVDLSSTQYARRRKELMQLISDLRSMGAQTMLDLPSIVVIGGQSAGKSSLVEAVSGVNVPRDSGTCTRCPMECTMSSSATTWSCSIKLRFDYDSAGRDLASGQREVAFGPAITDKNDVDIWLRRAQTAILNPDISPENFHRKNIQELRSFTSTYSLKFSRNVVSVFIEDPEATDLSFVDLPGLIQNEDREVVELVKELTVSYISRPNTIILTTTPMSDDIQNQLSVTLAREADPEGERTIGILTKPDTLGEGAVNAKKFWFDVIEGHQHKLKHGYYCVRLPDDAQRQKRLSRPALQRIAAEYFDTTPPWDGVTERRRLGIPGFVSDISVLLINHINRVLPQLKRDVEELLSSCLKEIGAIPKPLEVDPQIEVLVRVNEFCDALKKAVSGASSDKGLAQENRLLYGKFAQEIRSTAPDFRPFEEPYQYARIAPLEPEETAVAASGEVQVMGVFDVRKTIKDATSWELPGNIPYEAKTRLMDQFTALWTTPAERCLTCIYDVLDKVIEKLVKEHFGQFKVLQNLISDLIRPDINEHKSGALSAIRDTLKLETSPKYTQNLNDFRNLKDKWLGKYSRARQNPEEHKIPDAPTFLWDHGTGTGTHDPESVKQALYYLTRAGYQGLTQDDLARLSPRDLNFDEELIVMADVRAYFTIACKRIIDHIPLKIEHSLHHALVDKLSVNLLQRLMVDTASTGNFADRMKELVSEDPAIEAKRIEMEAKRIRLQDIKKKLVNFSA